MVSLLTEKYTLESVIVSTRTADLYRVTTPASVAGENLWLLRHTILPGSPAESRFIDRIQKICDLNLPGVSVIEYGIDRSGAAYVVMHPINGIKLSYTPRKIAHVERLIEGVVERIVTAHDAGLVCGDLSPSSFFLGQGGDIVWAGIVGSFEIEAQSTAAAPPIATYHYLSPEQRTGAGLSQASDVYALGVISYFLFSGQFPIGDSKRILLGPPDPATIIPIETLQPSTPPWAQVILPLCLKSNQSHRPPDARQLLDMIHSYREGKTLGVSSHKGVDVDAKDRALARSDQPIGEMMEWDRNIEIKVKDSTSALTVDQQISHYGTRNKQGGTDEVLKASRTGILARLGMGGTHFLLALVGIAAFVTVIGIVSLQGKESPVPPVKNLAASDDELRVEGAISKLEEEVSDATYRNAVNLASELHIKNAKALPKVEASLITAISKVYGQDVSERISGVLKDRSLDSCYQSLLTMFAPTIAIEDRFTVINDCLTVNQVATVQLISLIAVQPSGSGDWEQRLRISAHEVLGVDKVEGRTVPAIILARDALRSLIPPGKQAEMIENLSSEDLLWLFGSLGGEHGEIFAAVSKEAVRRRAISPPRSELLKPFIDGDVIDSRLRDGLIRAVSGRIDGETVGLAAHWLNRSSANILLALCAEAEESEIQLKAFDALASRKITQEPTASWVAYLKSNPTLWSRRGKYAKFICNSSFYDSLPDERRMAVIEGVGAHVDENKFLELLFSVGSPHFVREVAVAFGQDFSPNYLLNLLKVPDKETKIAALKHLKAYNDLYILRGVVEAFKREKDLDVKAVYRENYWVVRQHEEKNAGHELDVDGAAPSGEKPRIGK
jgi:serine/threonine protein kinase